MQSVSVSLAAAELNLRAAARSHAAVLNCGNAASHSAEHRRDGGRRDDRVERNVARGQQRAVGEGDNENRLHVTPPAEAPEHHPGAEQQHAIRRTSAMG